MINPFKEVNWNPDTAERRKFAKSLVIGFPCVALVFLIVGKLHGGDWNLAAPLWIGGVGVALGLIFLAVPAIAKPFYMMWYALACCIGIIVSNVLLIGFFYLMLTTIGLVMRAFGRQPMPKGFNKEAATYWQDAEPVADLKRYYRQF